MRNEWSSDVGLGTEDGTESYGGRSLDSWIKVHSCSSLTDDFACKGKGMIDQISED